MTGIRMVATDLDGTIVRRDQTISPRTTAALRACSEAGAEVVFVTGRPPRWMAPVVEATGLAGTAICGNGAIVYDLVAERVVRLRALAGDDALEVARRLERALPGCTLAVETLAGFRREPGYPTRWDTGAEQHIGPLAELLVDDPGVAKVLVRHPVHTADAMLAVAREVLDGLATPTHANAADRLLEVSAFGVSKAATLADIAAGRGITPAEVVAFGDMPNDLAMLRWAGRGFAMADGHPEAITSADAVAPPCSEDGVAQVLEALLAGEPPPPVLDAVRASGR